MYLFIYFSIYLYIYLCIYLFILKSGLVLHNPGACFGREPRQDSITVIQEGGDEGMDEGLSHRFREGGPEPGDIFEMIKS